MAHCPSQDWDRYINEQDAAAEAEIRFLQRNKDNLVALCCAIVRNPSVVLFAQPGQPTVPPSEVVDYATKMMQAIDAEDA